MPELPYDIHKVADALKQRTESGKHFSILAVAEGAISKEDAALTKREYKKKKSRNTYPSIAYEIADQLAAETGQEVRITIPGQMLMYGKEASNRKQEIDRQHYTIPNQRPKDKHCGKI